MIGFINAKINIGLNIVGRRPDGYHDLETVFYPVGQLNGTPENPEPFCDVMECYADTSVPHDLEISGISYRFSGNKVDCLPEKNLVVKAGSLFAESLRDRGLTLMPGTSITLDKHLPDGAGLGGGSADATSTLIMLNTMHDNPFTADELETMALELGADCPVFVRNRPAYAEGVGERLEPISLDLAGWWCVIAKPPVYVSTREAFAGVTPVRPPESIRELIELPVEEWRGRIVNDFEASIFPAHPELPFIKEHLYSCGAVYASMTGSGSALFGLFCGHAEAMEALRSLPPQTVGVPCLLK